MIPVLSAASMKAADENTINYHGIPSLVLMERAALSVVDFISEKDLATDFVAAVCGPGNNGADGVAIGRILHNHGINVALILLGNPDKYTSQLKQQIEIAKSYNVHFSTLDCLKDASLIVDSIFGIGLSKHVTGEFAEAIEAINNSPATVIACDMPSGYTTDTGKTLGCGVIADFTVTFGYPKKGLFLSEGYLHSGEVTIKDVGIYTSDTITVDTYTLTDDDLKLIPKKTTTSHKGSHSKVVLIAGSQEVYGAAYLAAKAAIRMGSGYVKVYTHKNNLEAFRNNLPEAVCIGYEDFDESALEPLLSWANSVLIGPGLSTSETSREILQYVINCCKKPMVIDADALNLISKNLSLLDTLKAPAVLTPHLLEMSRLCGQCVADISADMEMIARDFATSHDITLVLKDYTTFIASKNRGFINTSGDESLATAGSGDVLSGIIVSLLGMGISAELAAALGCYIHGKAGKFSAKKRGTKNLLASEIIDGIEIC